MVFWLLHLEFAREFPELGNSREIAPFLGLGFPGKMFGNFGKFWKFIIVSNVFRTFLEFSKSDAKPNFSLNSYVCDGVVVYTNVLLPNIDFQIFIINESI